MPLVPSYAKPETQSKNDLNASERSMRHEVDWNWHPITTGDYVSFMILAFFLNLVYYSQLI